MEEKKVSIVFMGTPDFAVASLKILLDHQYDVAAVVTAPDKPAGRGLKLRPSPVKSFAEERQIRVLQPTNLKSPEFHAELDETGANLYVVVAFRMLPEAVWKRPQYGTFNLHASLLPDYRGAAPINRAIMNGEKVTGVTTFFLNEQIDTGQILFSTQVPIGPDETAGQLHDVLMETGAQLVLKTVKAIETESYDPVDQDQLVQSPLKEAPKLFKEDCKINWNTPSQEVYNKIRGLNPYPGAWSELTDQENGSSLSFKVFDCHVKKREHDHAPGTIYTDGKQHIEIATADNGVISVETIQLAGKKKMSTAELLRGFQISKYTIQ